MKTLGIFVITFIGAFVIGINTLSLFNISTKTAQPQKVIIEIKGDGYQIEKPATPKALRVEPQDDELII